eukprot:46826-Eustigmatos_ZCMA.PRE.1
MTNAAHLELSDLRICVEGEHTPHDRRISATDGGMERGQTQITGSSALVQPIRQHSWQQVVLLEIHARAE